MTIDLKEYQRMQARVKKATSRRDKAKGALTQVLQRLKDEHGVGTLEAAEKLLAKKKRELTAAEAEFETNLAKFNEEWGNVFGSETKED